jgi:hypothetical protein
MKELSTALDPGGTGQFKERDIKQHFGAMSKRDRASAAQELWGIIENEGIPRKQWRSRNEDTLQTLEAEYPNIRNLVKAANVLQELISDDQTTISGGAGALGFTKGFLTGDKITSKPPANVAEYVRDTILDSSKGEKSVNAAKLAYTKARDDGEGNMNNARSNIEGFIKRVDFGDGTEKERHAIGPGQDVVAMSVNPEGNMVGALPYSVIAGGIDDMEGVNGWSREDIAAQIAQYANLDTNKKGLTPKSLDPKGLSPDEFAKATYPLREFATIMLAEKGRELKRAEEAGKDDKKAVEDALITASKEGFHETFFKNAKKNAVFAQKGGQDQLRDFYRKS